MEVLDVTRCAARKHETHIVEGDAIAKESKRSETRVEWCGGNEVVQM
jgi:hypothetical protein